MVADIVRLIYYNNATNSIACIFVSFCNDINYIYNIYTIFKNNHVIEQLLKKIFKFISKAIVISTSVLMLSLLAVIPCIYDKAGKSFYKLKRYESSYKKHLNPTQSAHIARHLKHQLVNYVKNI